MTDEARSRWRSAAPSPGLGFSLWLSRSIPLIRGGYPPPYQVTSPYAPFEANLTVHEPPTAPDYPIAYYLRPENHPCLWTLKWAETPQTYTPRPHDRKLTLISWCLGTERFAITHMPWRDWHHAWIEIQARCDVSGIVLATFTDHIHTA